MACPYFYPLTRMEGADPYPARAPLLRLYSGECRAQAQSSIPGDSTQRQYCNFGYGRGGCASFPPEAEADAVRFSGSGKSMLYILEREWCPVSHGTPTSPPSATVARQADIYNLENQCLNRR
jgi:hypothetical protein